MNKIDIPALKRRLREELTKLSGRERGLIAGAIVAILFLVVWQSYEKVRSVFKNQSLKIEAARQDLGDIRERFQRFSALHAKRKAIEEQYKEVEIKDGVRSHLEELLKSKAGVSSGYNIRELTAVEFGGNYEQAPFSLKFTVGSLEGLVDFLKELVQGAHPLVVTELEIKREPIGDKLKVSVDVSSIRRVSSAANGGVNGGEET